MCVPALDSKEPYSSRLSARSALYDQLRLLISDDQQMRSTDEYRHRVVTENVLALRSDSARRKLWKELRSRYILDSTDPLFRAFWTEWRRTRSEEERGLTVYVFFALHDRLVFDLGVRFLSPLLRKAPKTLTVADVQAFFKRAAVLHPEVTAWSASTTVAVAQKYTASIRDFGLARGSLRKETVRPAIHGAPVRLLIRALLLAGRPSRQVLHAPEFRLLAMSESEIIPTLEDLHRRGEIGFRIQADVVELDVEGPGN